MGKRVRESDDEQEETHRSTGSGILGRDSLESLERNVTTH